MKVQSRIYLELLVLKVYLALAFLILNIPAI